MTRTLYCVKVHVVFLYSFISFAILASRLACAALKVGKRLLESQPIRTAPHRKLKYIVRRGVCKATLSPSVHWP